MKIDFPLGPDGLPSDVPSLVKGLAHAANAQFPFNNRLDTDGDWFTLVPTRTRDLLDQTITVMPLLGRRVTIPPGKRTIAASAELMARELSTQTRLRVSCCQAFVAGIPWGMAEIPFEASDEPARSVLKRLIAPAGGQAVKDYWLQRCDPQPSQWCFINLLHVSRESTSSKAASLEPHGERNGSPWFQLSRSKR